MENIKLPAIEGIASCQMVGRLFGSGRTTAASSIANVLPASQEAHSDTIEGA
jgi:hypothetical protein